MEVTVRGHHWNVPEPVADYARRKLGRLYHYLPLLEDGSAELDLTHQKAKQPAQRYLAKAQVRGHGVHLLADEHAAQPEVAIDLAADALASQARRQKERLYGRNRPRRTAATPTVSGAGADADDEDGPLAKVAEVRRLQLKPMTAEEAVEQIEVLGEDFLLFQDADEDTFSLIYRRKSGGYGLILGESA